LRLSRLIRFFFHCTTSTTPGVRDGAALSFRPSPTCQHTRIRQAAGWQGTGLGIAPWHAWLQAVASQSHFEGSCLSGGLPGLGAGLPCSQSVQSMCIIASSHLVSIRPHTDGWERSTSRGCDTDAMEDRGGEASTSWQVFRQRTLHAAAGDSAGDGQQRRCPAAQPLPGNASRTLLTALTKSSHTATLRAGHLCPWPTWLPRQRRRLASRGRKSGSRRACARPPQPCLSVPARAAWQRRPPPSVRAPLTLGALQAQAEGGAGQGEP